MPAPAACAMRASASSVRSTTSTAASSPAATGSCPAARRAPCSLEPNRRSGQSSATRAMPGDLLRAAAVELLAHRLRPAPHLHDLDPARARLAQHELALDALVVEERERSAHGLRCGCVPELVRRA